MQVLTSRQPSEVSDHGSRRVFGAMIESHIHPGAQEFTPGRDDPAKLAYGISITDPCLGWEHTVEALRTLSDAVRRRRG
jgi:3-deoxy-7-phosphoheptulonate synthase